MKDARQEDLIMAGLRGRINSGQMPKGGALLGSNLENHPVYGDKLILIKLREIIFSMTRQGPGITWCAILYPTNPAGYESGGKFNVNRDYLLPITGLVC
ncbi:hypothetical protein [Phocaeicola dorei]|uniref:hypothetical protein n=1 Tax=Phocaeicola dorei TaxID=357276 RepID=UPI00211DE980|nr:hypothetical protein [Phocaeicola dorei]